MHGITPNLTNGLLQQLLAKYVSDINVICKWVSHKEIRCL